MKVLFVLFALFFSNHSMAYSRADVEVTQTEALGPGVVRFACRFVESGKESELVVDIREDSSVAVSSKDTNGNVSFVASANRIFVTAEYNYILEVHFAKTKEGVSEVYLSKSSLENKFIFGTTVPLSAGFIGLLDASDTRLAIRCNFIEVASL